MKKIIVKLSNERLITPSGLTLVGGALGKSDLVKRANRMAVDKKRSQPQIKNGDILLTYIGLLCQGKTSFDSVREFHADADYFTMGSADFSQFVVTTDNGTACETSTLKVRALSPHPPATFTGTSSNLLDFIAFSRLIRISQPYMWFLSVRPRVCLQLPSDPTSRWTPLLFSYVLRRCLRVLGTYTR